MNYKIRKSNIEDSEIILTFIKELAAYEQLEEHVVADINDIEKTIFCNNPKAEVLILELDAEPAGFALFFHNYSSFLCKYGIHIEHSYRRYIC